MKLESDERVNDVFSDYPASYRKKTKAVRRMIIDVARTIPELTVLVETLKWGEPSYLPKERKVGTTVRVHWLKTKPERYGVYFNCQTNLISQFKKKFPGKFTYDGKRALLFTLEDAVPENELKACIKMALTYHLSE